MVLSYRMIGSLDHDGAVFISLRRGLRFMHIAAVIVLVFITISKIAYASEKEEQFYATFESVCISLLNNPAKIPSMIDAMGGIQLSLDKATTMLQGKKGTVWVINSHFLALTTDNVCALAGQEFSGALVERIFKESSRSILIYSEKIGTQTNTYYSLIQSSFQGERDIRAIVAIIRSNLASLDGAILTAMSKETAEKIGITIKKWPN